MIAAATKSVEDTRDLAGALAGVARAGDVLLLSGDLGAGKTAFAQGFGRGLGVTDAITSPTFMLVQQYAGRVPMIHVDIYRLEHLQEVIDLGLPEMLDDGAVAVIEWGEAAAPVLAPEYLYVRITFGDADDDREFAVEPVGLSWSGRLATLATPLDQWVRR